MKNKLRLIGTIITIIILTTSAVVWSFSPKTTLKPSEYGIGITYSSAMQDNKPFIALFFTDWCTYCMRVMPKYKMIADIYKGKYNFVMLNAEDPAYAKLVEDYAIGGFPTIYIIDPSIDNRILINNTIYDDLSKIRVELDRYLRIRAMIK